MASNNTAGIAQARKLVEQLKMEANVDRMKVVGFCVCFFFLNATFAHFMQKKKKKSSLWAHKADNVVVCAAVAVKGK